MWGWGANGGTKVSYVSKEDVYKPRRNEGIRVSDVRHANQALVNKWRWRTIVGETSL